MIELIEMKNKWNEIKENDMKEKIKIKIRYIKEKKRNWMKIEIKI